MGKPKRKMGRKLIEKRQRRETRQKRLSIRGSQRSSLKKFGCDLMFFDQNIIHALVHISMTDAANTFLESLKHWGIIQPGIRLFHTTSELSMVEILGIGREVIVPFSEEELNRILEEVNDPEDAKSRSFAFYHEKICALPAMQQEYLIQKIQEKMRYSTELGNMTLKRMEKTLLIQTGYTNSLALALTMDRVYGHPYPSRLRESVCHSFLVDIARNISLGNDFNQCRGMQKALEGLGTRQAAQQISASEGVASEDVIRQMVRIVGRIGFDGRSDLVDTNIAHFSAIGMHQNKHLKPVLCFTMDDKSETRMRATMVREFANFILGQIAEKHRDKEIPFKLVYPKPGAIGYVSRNGEITSIERVAEIPHLLSLDAMEEA